MSSRRRGVVAIGAAMVIAAVAALIATAAPAPSRPAGVGLSTVTVSQTPVTAPLADNFLGLALEFNTIPEWVGPGPGAVNPPLVQLIRNLDPVGSPLIRIGGQSSDRSWWPVRGLAPPLGVTYTLTPAWTSAARALATAAGAQYMLGLNLEANRTRIPQQEATQLLDRIGASHVQSFQLGNEPELYRNTPWYRVLHGKPVPWYSKVGSPAFARAPGYNADAYASEFARMAPLLPTSVPLAGPETGNPDWMQTFTGFISAHSRVRTLTFHGYGTSDCARNPADPEFPTIAHQLSEQASRTLVNGFGSAEAIAHRDGASIRIDELGSVTCNGSPGVSDTMASALWAADALFALARSGIDGVNLHTYPGSVNGLFDLTQTHGVWRADVHPLYYGALMFAQAAPPGSRLLALTTGSQDTVRAWATISPDRTIRVLLINDSTTAPVTTAVSTPAGYGSRTAALERLNAPGVSATTGVTLGGRQFGATTTGVLAPPIPQSVAPHSRIYRIDLPPASAALLTLPPA